MLPALEHSLDTLSEPSLLVLVEHATAIAATAKPAAAAFLPASSSKPSQPRVWPCSKRPWTRWSP